MITLAVLWVITVPGSATAKTAGSLDPTFGAKGTVTTSFGPGRDQANAIVVQPDGAIVAAGSHLRGTPTVDHVFALARYLPDGTLDPTFSTNGKTKTRLGMDAEAEGVALQPHGKIVAVGWSWSDSPRLGGTTTIVLARYLPDGSLDPTFGGDGTVKTWLGPHAYGNDVAIQSDGKIVVAGSARGGFALVRYNADGTLDPTFGGGGKVTTSFQASAPAFGVAVRSDGGIVAAGTMYTDADGDGVFAAARYLADGSLDPSFSADGMVTTAFGAGLTSGADVALQADGKIVVGGGTGKVPRGADVNFALARYNPDGSMDPTFGVNGKVRTFFSLEDDHANALAIQPNGRIVAAGWSEGHGFALARYTVGGALDPTFGGDGKVTTSSFGSGWQAAMAVALQSDGKILAAGRGPTGGGDFALARYLG